MSIIEQLKHERQAWEGVSEFLLLRRRERRWWHPPLAWLKWQAALLFWKRSNGCWNSACNWAMQNGEWRDLACCTSDGCRQEVESEFGACWCGKYCKR